MRTMIDERGKLEIPKELREQARLVPGAQVEVELDGYGGVHVRPVSPDAAVERAEPSPARLEREGSVLVVSGVTYDGSWGEMVGAVRQDQIEKLATC